MAHIELHPDFKDFLKLLNSNGVEYLVVGGYAVGFYGYPRSTGDMDIWIEISPSNASRTLHALIDFGIPEAEVRTFPLTLTNRVVRMGVPPVRIELITTATGVDFSNCYSRRKTIEIDGTPVPFIALEDLKENKRACGRHKDMDDLEHLP